MPPPLDEIGPPSTGNAGLVDDSGGSAGTTIRWLAVAAAGALNATYVLRSTARRRG